jgi:hypothetical protein
VTVDGVLSSCGPTFVAFGRHVHLVVRSNPAWLDLEMTRADTLDFVRLACHTFTGLQACVAPLVSVWHLFTGRDVWRHARLCCIRFAALFGEWLLVASAAVKAALARLHHHTVVERGAPPAPPMSSPPDAGSRVRVCEGCGGGACMRGRVHVGTARIAAAGTRADFCAKEPASGVLSSGSNVRTPHRAVCPRQTYEIFEYFRR